MNREEIAEIVTSETNLPLPWEWGKRNGFIFSNNELYAFRVKNGELDGISEQVESGSVKRYDELLLREQLRTAANRIKTRIVHEAAQ